jgi:hypothetical protein
VGPCRTQTARPFLTLAVLGDRLAPARDPVAVADRGLDHRVTDGLQYEQLTVADQLPGEREDVLD